jgi:hypothetical protein
MCYEWYEESLLDAAITRSKEKAEKTMHPSPPAEPEPAKELRKEPREEPIPA